MAYTCNDFRQEMKLLAYRQQLSDGDLSDVERALLIKEIKNIETELGMCDTPEIAPKTPRS